MAAVLQPPVGVTPGSAVSGAHLLLASLKALGVDLIFGYPGGASLPIYAELPRWRGAIRHVLVRHEQNAAHAADGHWRASGRLAACTATSGPGATNLVTGLATAWMDGVPLIALTGQVPTAVIGTLAFQEVDIVSVARPVTKAVFQARRTEELPRLLAEAVRVATGGRPGPVLVDIPKDVLVGEAAIECLVGAQELADAPGLPTAGLARLAEVADLLARAERPVLLAGQGVIRADATAELRRLAERTGTPVGTTLLGLGSFPEDHPLALGMVGMHGTVQANVALHHADLIVGLGARFDDRVVGRARDFAPGATIVHVDVDPRAFGRVVRCDVPVLCDVGIFLRALADRAAWGSHLEWPAWLRGWGEAHRECGEADGGLTSPGVIRAIRAVADEDTVVVADVGQHQMFAALYWRHTSPEQFFTTGGLGTMGYALPAAMGAQLARPDATVWAIVGDGGFQMSAPELSTLVAERIPVKVAILNNRYLGMVRQWQEQFCDGVYSACFLPQPDFAGLAEAHGCFPLRVEDPAQVPSAVERALAVDGPAVLDFRVRPDEMVWPIVPPGASVGEFLCAEGRVIC